MPHASHAAAYIDATLIEQLSTALAQGALFLTPNTRLAGQLRLILDAIRLDQFEAENVQPDISVWQTPTVIPFETWTISSWQSAMLAGEVPARLILTPGQDALYWEQALEQSESSLSLLSKSAASSQARQGYQLLRQSLVPIEQHEFEFNSALDSRAYLEWIKNYQQIVAKSTHIPLVDAQAQLLSLPSKRFLLDSQLSDTETIDQQKPMLVMVGFHAPSALQLALANKYVGPESDLSGGLSADADVDDTDVNKRVVFLQLSKRCQQLNSSAYTDFASEVKAAAHWSKAIQIQQPDARIAIVIQNLSQQKMLVERSFIEVFEPDKVYDADSILQNDFNISAGIPLSESGLVKIALLIIDSLARPLSIEEWQSVLMSPYIGGNFKFRRALLDSAYEAGEREYTLAQISRLLLWRSNGFTKDLDDAEQDSVGAGDKEPASLLAGLAQAAQLYIASRSGGGKAKSAFPSQWLPKFRELLNLFIWPGQRTLNSDEYQQLSSFDSHCQLFAGLDSIVGKVSLAKASSLFRRHCQNQVFHRETVKKTDGSQHVQILGALEASGQTFDYLWLTGMSERQWPAAPQAHPLIPRGIQIQYAMPSASVEREFEYAKRLTQGYLCGANSINISYPTAIDDITCHISPLLSSVANTLDLSLNDWSADPSDKNIGGDLLAAASELADELNIELEDEQLFENIADHFGKPLRLESDPQLEDKALLAGGSGMLKDYNVNPLKAYFKWRLGVKAPAAVVLGVSPLERGNTLHEALETIWQALGGSAALQDCTLAQIKQLLEETTEESVDQVLARRFTPVSSRLKQLEKQRLKNILLSWLAIESERPAFVIDALEKPMVCTIGEPESALNIQLRIDRIDRLDDGQLLMIDYKSGNSFAAGWFDDNVTEPQLPLYACAVDDDEAVSSSKGLAIAYAKLKAGELAYDGIADDAGSAQEIKGITSLEKRRNCEAEDWSSLLQHWRSRFVDVANEIINASAVVDINLRGVDDAVYEPAMRLNSSATTSSVTTSSVTTSTAAKGEAL